VSFFWVIDLHFVWGRGAADNKVHVDPQQLHPKSHPRNPQTHGELAKVSTFVETRPDSHFVKVCIQVSTGRVF